jgi:hypothetical protein
MKKSTLRYVWAMVFTASVLFATVSSWTIGTIK